MNRDILRQSVNMCATIAVIVCSFAGSIITGHSVGEVAHRHPVPVTPADYAFLIWNVIYLGLIVFAIYQALPAQRANPRLRRIGYWYALSCLGSIAWEFTWLNEQVNLSLVMMALIFFPLLLVYIRADINRVRCSRAESWFVNAPFGIYLGWITVASIVNVAVVLANLGWQGSGISPTVWTALLLVVGTAIGVYVGLRCVDIAYVAVIAWAFLAILLKNSDQPLIVFTAALMVIVACATCVYIALRHDALLRLSSQYI